MVKNSERISESFVELVLRSYNENDLKKNKQSIIDLLKAIDGLNSPSPYDQLTNMKKEEIFFLLFLLFI